MKNCLIVRLLNCLAVASIAFASGCATIEEKANEDCETVKVLMIGNSFSICVLNHLPKIAEESGEKLDLASLYIGGCTLKKNWTNATNVTDRTFRPYRYDRVVRGKRIVDGAKRNVLEVVAGTKWDIVTVQQGSHESWKPESYHPYGDNLIAKIHELAPQAKILVQETWSYTPWDKRLKKWGIDQNQMYDKLHDAYAAFAKQHGLDVIPFGTAVQEWRRKLPVRYTDHSFGGDVVAAADRRSAITSSAMSATNGNRIATFSILDARARTFRRSSGRASFSVPIFSSWTTNPSLCRIRTRSS